MPLKDLSYIDSIRIDEELIERPDYRRKAETLVPEAGVNLDYGRRRIRQNETIARNTAPRFSCIP
jgi:hypothetical protein